MAAAHPRRGRSHRGSGLGRSSRTSGGKGRVAALFGTGAKLAKQHSSRHRSRAPDCQRSLLSRTREPHPTRPRNPQSERPTRERRPFDSNPQPSSKSLRRTYPRALGNLRLSRAAATDRSLPPTHCSAGISFRPSSYEQSPRLPSSWLRRKPPKPSFDTQVALKSIGLPRLPLVLECRRPHNDFVAHIVL